MKKVKATFSKDGYSGYAIIEMGGNPSNEQLFKACSDSEFLYDVLSQEDTEISFFFHASKENGFRQWIAELDAPDGRTLTEGGDHSDIIYVLNLVSLEILS